MDESAAGPSIETGPCSHLGCGCSAEGTFCSDFCRDNATHASDHGPEFDCGCGHEDCKTVVGEA
jgi:hypothetical protein